MAADVNDSLSTQTHERDEPGAAVFVWSAWAILTLGALAFVAQFGTNVPLWDDYGLLDQMTGTAPVTVEWLWAQHNEHRIAVPKVVLVFAQRLAGNDVRAAMFLNVVFLSALAAIWIRLAARLPGGLRASDALFPLLILHVGHAANLLWSIQLVHVLPTALGGAALALFAARESWPQPSVAVAVGAILALLPLCGGTGLMYAPALALWLVGWATVEARPGTARFGRAVALILLAVPGVALAAAYFHGFHKVPHPEGASGPLEAARAGVQFLTSGLGMTAAQGWPWSGLATVSLTAVALLCLARAWVRQPVERPRVFGLLSFFAAPLALAAAVGWGRGWSGAMAGFQERYVTMAVPLWAWIAIVFRLYGPSHLGRFVPNVLFTALCVLLWPNTEAALRLGRERTAVVQNLARDLRSGVPAHRIVKRYTPFLHPSQDELSRLLPKLRNARVGPFGHLRDSPDFQSIPLALNPTALRQTRWDGATANITGMDPQITFTLPSPRVVTGIRIRYAHKNRQGARARFQLTWRRPGQVDYNADQRYANWDLPTGPQRETTVWVDDLIADFRIQPDNQPCEFRIDAIMLLCP